MYFYGLFAACHGTNCFILYGAFYYRRKSKRAEKPSLDELLGIVNFFQISNCLGQLWAPPALFHHCTPYSRTMSPLLFSLEIEFNCSQERSSGLLYSSLKAHYIFCIRFLCAYLTFILTLHQVNNLKHLTCNTRTWNLKSRDHVHKAKA